MSGPQDSDPVAEMAGHDGQTAVVRVDAIRRIDALVAELGGDPAALFARSQLDPAILDNRHAMLPFRTLVHLLERAADELNCADFGMRLAAMQGGAKVLGPLEIVMRNSPSIDAAFRYCADHMQAYSTGTQWHIGPEGADGRLFLRFDILLARLPCQRQTVEHGLALLHHIVMGLSDGSARAREVWLTHQPHASPDAYADHFACPVHFGKSANGVWFDRQDFAASIAGSDPQLYEMATNFVETRYPAREPVLSARVRSTAERLLLEGNCTFAQVSAMLGMHPRSLQRRLRAEGESFEAIKDGVRRDIALRYLTQSELPLIRIAEILGYSETSVLSRSCFRWFSASPRQLRGGN